MLKRNPVLKYLTNLKAPAQHQMHLRDWRTSRRQRRRRCRCRCRRHRRRPAGTNQRRVKEIWGHFASEKSSILTESQVILEASNDMFVILLVAVTL